MSTAIKNNPIRVMADPPDSAEPAEIDRLAKAEFEKEQNLKDESSSDKEGCVKLEAKKMDPAQEACLLLVEHRIGEFRRLHFWSGGFWYWIKGKFIPIPNSEARVLIVRSLNSRFTMVGTKEVSNVMEQVRSAALLSCLIQPPSWLCENEWKPEDLIATENLIVHLPSFVTGV